MRPELVDDSVAAMNLVAENTRNGVQVTWQVYSPEEIAANSSLGCVQLYYFPGKEPGGKYALVVPGNGSTMTSEMEEGGSTAYQLHEQGYTVFVLRYRTWIDMGDNAPIQDLANAVKFITAHAGQFGVQPENYALVKKALLEAGREDLIGYGENCLIPPRPWKNETKTGKDGRKQRKPGEDGRKQRKPGEERRKEKPVSGKKNGYRKKKAIRHIHQKKKGGQGGQK